MQLLSLVKDKLQYYGGMHWGGGVVCLWSPGKVLLETLMLLSIIGTFSSQWLLCKINLAVDSTSNNAEDHCYKAWCVVEGQVYRFGCTGLKAMEALLKVTTSKCTYRS